MCSGKKIVKKSHVFTKSLDGRWQMYGLMLIIQRWVFSTYKVARSDNWRDYGDIDYDDDNVELEEPQLFNVKLLTTFFLTGYAGTFFLLDGKWKRVLWLPASSFFLEWPGWSINESLVWDLRSPPIVFSGCWYACAWEAASRYDLIRQSCEQNAETAVVIVGCSAWPPISSSFSWLSREALGSQMKTHSMIKRDERVFMS